MKNLKFTRQFQAKIDNITLRKIFKSSKKKYFSHEKDRGLEIKKI